MGDGIWVAVYDHFLGFGRPGRRLFFKMISERSRPPEKGESALDILKKRYTKGEITKEEFEKMKDDLMKS